MIKNCSRHGASISAPVDVCLLIVAGTWLEVCGGCVAWKMNLEREIRRREEEVICLFAGT